MQIPAIILAAGASSRLGHPKQLVKAAGETLLARTIRLCTEAGASSVHVVLGANRDIIVQEVRIEPGIEVFNPAWKQGIASSIHAGLRAVESSSSRVTGVLLLTCDQPELSSRHLRNLRAAFEDRESAQIAASAYAGTLGVPALFPRSSFPDLYALTGDRGARSLIARSPHLVVQVAFIGGEIDIDQPSDLSHLD